MVMANNALTIRQIRNTIINDQVTFPNILTVGQATVDRVLRRNALRMKQIYRVPFNRNSDRVKDLRHDYVQRVLELEAAEESNTFIYIDEAGFNLSKTRRRGRNIIGQRAIINVPGQRGGNITLCAAINHNGILHHHSIIGPYNTARLLIFLDTLHNTLIPPDQIVHAEQPRYVVIWDNVSFHRAALIHNWFTNHPRFLVLPLPPYSPFLNAIEEFFSAWRWKVYERNPQAQMPLIQAMEEACGNIAPEAFQGWIRHTRRYFPRCLARENIACDVDEVLWPDRIRRQDAA
ncbi:uncharacterized protein LOC134023930 [Osmerus eperlanus]|uniref:uncharacterized protein LOC134023930 n=1 Tax=Osmerus eperlanus TaxID=29151 RepID=UPI002E125293